MKGTCLRCGGWMVETFMEGEAECRDDPAGTWKCVNCGEMIDSQILANRQVGSYLQGVTVHPALSSGGAWSSLLTDHWM